MCVCVCVCMCVCVCLKKKEDFFLFWSNQVQAYVANIEYDITLIDHYSLKYTIKTSHCLDNIHVCKVHVILFTRSFRNCS